MCLSMHLFIRQVLSPPVLRSTSWPVPRRQQNNAARLLLATSKMKQFCETFSLFAVENIKNEAILRDFLQKWKVDCTADGLVPMRFAIFPHAVSLKYCACHEKVSPGHTKCCTCHEKASWHSWWFDTPKCNPSQEISSLSSNISAEDASCTAPATKNASVQILFKSPTPAIVFENATKPSRFSRFSVDAQSTPPTTQNDVWTSKMSPRPSVFNTFDFQMCFAPQRRTLFRHLNVQKCSETDSF